MKNFVSVALIGLLCASTAFVSCKKEENTTKKDVIVFAAASLKESLTEIGNQYMSANKNVNIVYNFDSSGTLRTQIKNGASADIFISAAPKQMNELEDGGYIDNSTRVNLLENKVVLAVTDANKKGIKSFDDLAARLRSGDVFLAIGNSDVPVGQYTKKIFDYYKLNEDDLNKKGSLTYGGNVKEVTSQVKEATVDAGIIYGTDAFSAGLKTVDNATKEMCGQVIYPAAIIKNAPNRSDADMFFSYLKSKNANKEFEKVGFVPFN